MKDNFDKLLLFFIPIIFIKSLSFVLMLDFDLPVLNIPLLLMYSNSDDQANKPLLTGTRLRSYAFALLTRKEYAKAELIAKLSLYAQDRDEVLALVEELSERQYQSDQRVAEMVLSSQIRKGKGPNRIKQALKHKQLDSNLILEDIQDK